MKIQAIDLPQVSDCIYINSIITLNTEQNNEKLEFQPAQRFVRSGIVI